MRGRLSRLRKPLKRTKKGPNTHCHPVFHSPEETERTLPTTILRIISELCLIIHFTLRYIRYYLQTMQGNPESHPVQEPGKAYNPSEPSGASFTRYRDRSQQGSESSTESGAGKTPAASGKPEDGAPDLSRRTEKSTDAVDNPISRQDIRDLIRAFGLERAEPRADLRSMTLPHSEQFTGKNASDFITRLEDRFEWVNVSSDPLKCQALLLNVAIEMAGDIKGLRGYRERDWDVVRAAFLEEYEIGDERQKKETLEYLEELAAQSEKGNIDTKGYIKEFKTYWPAVYEKGETTSSSGAKVFICGLPRDVKLQVNTILHIRPTIRSTFSNINLIIAEAERIVLGNENMDMFTLGSKATAGIERIVKKTVAARSEGTGLKGMLGPAKLRPDLIEALERLNLNKIPKSVAQHSLSISNDPVFIAARGDNLQLALATNYINTTFVDDYNTASGVQLARATGGNSSFTPTDRPRYAGTAAQQPTRLNPTQPGYPVRPPPFRACHSCSSPDHMAGTCPDLAELIAEGICHWNRDVRWFCWGPQESPGPRIMGLRSGQDFGLQIRGQREAQGQAQQAPAPAPSALTGVHSIGKAKRYLASSDELSESDIGGDGNYLVLNHLYATTRGGKEKATVEYTPRLSKVTKVSKSAARKPTVKHAIRGRFQEAAASHFEAQNDERDGMTSGDESDGAAELNQSQEQPLRKSRNPTLRQYVTKRDRTKDGIRLASNILEQPITISLQDAVTHIPAFRDLLYSSLPDEIAENVTPELEEMERRRRKKREERKARAAAAKGDRGGINNFGRAGKLTADVVESVDKANNRARVSAKSPISRIQIGGCEISSLLDSGAEVNVITQKAANRCRLGINNFSNKSWGALLDRLHVADGRKVPLLGWTTATIRIAEASFEYTNIVFIVLRHCAHPIILGQPFSVRSQLHIMNRADGGVSCRAFSTDGADSVTWRAAMAEYDYGAWDSEAEGVVEEFEDKDGSLSSEGEEEEVEEYSSGYEDSGNEAAE